MLSVHFFLELVAVYLIAVKLLHIPLKRKLRWHVLTISIVLLLLDAYRFIYQHFIIIELPFDRLIYSGLAMILFLLETPTLKNKCLVVLIQLFSNFLLTSVAGFFIILTNLTIQMIVFNPIYLNIIRVLTILLIGTALFITRKKGLILSINSLTWPKLFLILVGLFGFGYYVAFFQQFGRYYVNTMGQFANFFATLSGFLVIIIVVSLILKDNELANITNEKKIQSHLIESLKLYHQVHLEQEVETIKFRHDIQKHLQIIDVFLKTQEHKEAKNYVNELIHHSQEISDGFYHETGSKTVNAILFYLQKQYKDENIDILWTGNIPENTKIKEKDFATIFMNLLENAFRAASEVANETKILVEIIAESSFLKINIRNPYKEVIKLSNGDFSTTKSNKINSGYGLKIIKNTVLKYEGEQKIEAKDGVFNYEIIFVF